MKCTERGRLILLGNEQGAWLMRNAYTRIMRTGPVMRTILTKQPDEPLLFQLVFIGDDA